MIIQTLVVFLEAFTLYFVLIGISGIRFKETTCSKVMGLTYFNDNQEALEDKLVSMAQNTQEIQNNYVMTLQVIKELQLL